MDNCLLIDGNNLIYSSYYVAKKIKKEIINSTIFFFLKVLISILKYDEYQRLIIFFDKGKDIERRNIILNYKVNRKPMPEELWNEIKNLPNILKSFKIVCLQMDNVEADDLIASFVNQVKKFNFNIVIDIFTKDKDFLQLLDKNINILKKNINGKINRYTINDFWKDYKFFAHNYIDYLSLIGDKADNIKGLLGIGPVTAKNLIQKFETIDKIYELLENKQNVFSKETKNKILKENKNILQNNKKVITLNKNIHFLSTINEIYNNSFFNWKEWKKNQELNNFCFSNNFKSLLKMLEK